jgi:hypothetical protein
MEFYFCPRRRGAERTQLARPVRHDPMPALGFQQPRDLPLHPGRLTFQLRLEKIPDPPMNAV